ncbi:cysteine hydrolase family protein [Terricaulis silvestris]|uniref:Peroxyureidoacrylate/ureidoacrylate amidohydrolase RutB n=1 Tax=Terricaulis silvestris TaxID=2686094 RepID=A0A6I6MRE5_9CAUL|nr:cysteine hydrolase [Terricaulis silvestris]QGZ93713.1 Peroxyureidoacrylate/ureidoacrylate amidohydrolase RutB [Terricaulis silvestris]
MARESNLVEPGPQAQTQARKALVEITARSPETKEFAMSITRRAVVPAGLASITAMGLASSSEAQTVDESLTPGEAAVVMVDFQNNFASPEGSGYAAFAEQFRATHMIENSLALVNGARERGIQVIHVTEGYTDDYREVDMGNGATFHRNAVQWQAFKSSSVGAQLYAPIRHDSDVVFPDRKTMSGFGSNPLDFFLKSRGIHNVAVAGFTADMCVYATLLAGFDLGYRMYAMTDAVVAGSPPLTQQMVGVLYPFVARSMTSREFLAMFRARARRR